ncbi:MAG: hypothetical protein AB7F89_11300 [Pirellulaceae bacterium]
MNVTLIARAAGMIPLWSVGAAIVGWIVGMGSPSCIAADAGDLEPVEPAEAVSTLDGTASASRDVAIRRWIQDWQDGSFAVRREASRQLALAGIDAYEPLTEVVLRGERESRVRALAILSEGLAGQDERVQREARAALERIAASDHAAAARAAQEVLRKTDESKQLARGQNVRQFGAARMVLPNVVVNGRVVAMPGVAPAWPIGPIPPPGAPQAPPFVPGNPGNMNLARNAARTQVLASLEQSIAMTRFVLAKTQDQTQRAALQQQLIRQLQMRDTLTQQLVPRR